MPAGGVDARPKSIRAAAEWAEAEAEARGEEPIELALGRQFFDDRLGMLEPGGLLDQPLRLTRTITACRNAVYALAEYAKAPAGSRAKWKADHPDLADVIYFVDLTRDGR